VSVAGPGDGSLPRSRMIAGMNSIGGSVLFFSQLLIVCKRCLKALLTPAHR
jgi:hypothetical protein